MWYRAGLIALFSAVVAGSAIAGELPSMFGAPGVLLALGEEEASGPVVAAEDSMTATVGKSPKKAFVLSALLPGAGEYYIGAKKRAMLFFGLEALAWGLYVHWNSKGDDLEDKFRRIADEHWDPLDYIDWRNSGNSRFSSITHSLPCSSAVALWTGENKGSFGDCGSSEVQQYYELLGKYDQFVAGWDDVADSLGGDPVPNPVQIDSVKNFYSAQRVDYENRRGESNKFLKRASNVAGLILVNHVFSAIDAARVARARSQGVDEAVLERRTRFLVGMQSGSRGSIPMLMAFKSF